jgi:hypothetical protein
LTNRSNKNTSLTYIPQQTTPNATPAKSSASKRASRPTSSLAKAPTTPPRSPKPRHACKASKAPNPFLPTPTSAAPRTRRALLASRTTAISRLPRKTSFASSVSPPAMISRTCRACWATVPPSCRVRLGTTLTTRFRGGRLVELVLVVWWGVWGGTLKAAESRFRAKHIDRRRNERFLVLEHCHVTSDQVDSRPG